MHIAVANQKGGVGKTTVTAHLAAGLARRGHETLAIDLDPQGYLTMHFGLREDLYEAEIDNIALHLTKNSEEPVEELVQETDEGVDLIPSNYQLRGIEQVLSGEVGRERRLEQLLDELPGYDYIVVDTPPSLGVLTDNALLACRNVVIPIQAEDTSIQAIQLIFDEITEIEDAFDSSIAIAAIVPNLVPRDGVAETTLEQLRSVDALKDDVTPFEIRKRADIKYAMRHGQTLYTYNQDADMIEHFDQLADRIATQAQGGA